MLRVGSHDNERHLSERCAEHIKGAASHLIRAFIEMKQNYNCLLYFCSDDLIQQETLAVFQSSLTGNNLYGNTYSIKDFLSASHFALKSDEYKELLSDYCKDKKSNIEGVVIVAHEWLLANLYKNIVQDYDLTNVRFLGLDFYYFDYPGSGVALLNIDNKEKCTRVMLNG